MLPAAFCRLAALVFILHDCVKRLYEFFQLRRFSADIGLRSSCGLLAYVFPDLSGDTWLPAEHIGDKAAGLVTIEGNAHQKPAKEGKHWLHFRAEQRFDDRLKKRPILHVNVLLDSLLHDLCNDS